MRIIDACISHKRTVLSILFLLLVAGFNAYLTIPKESDPDITIPIVYVSLHLEGIAPEDSETLLLRPAEQELRSIEGLDEMRSSAYENGGNVVLEFEAGYDIDQALNDVREAVDKFQADLPAEADEPTVSEVNFSLFPILTIGLSGPVPERTLVELVNGLQDRVENIPSVLEANIGGDREDLIEVTVDPVKLEGYNIDIYEVISLFNQSNRLVAAGTLDDGLTHFAIKVPGLFETAEDVLNMPIAVEGDAVVLFRDVAEIRQTFKDVENYARFNGDPAVTLEVVKRSGENIIDTINEVRRVVEEETLDWPEMVEISYTQDRSEDIRRMLRDLQNNVLSAVLLVMMIIIGVLGVRTGFLVGVAIPGSFLTAILILDIMGITVNIVVLFALILAVGMLVDGAIVVTEFADRKMAEGMHPAKAYATASRRMALPVIASTATTLAAFFPLLFWPGIVGEFMKYLPLTLLFTLSASLVMALIFIPTLGALIGKAVRSPSTQADGEGVKPVSLAGDETGDLRDLPGWTGKYVRFLDRMLDMPGRIALAAFGTLIVIIMIYSMVSKGALFFPNIEPEAATVLIHARGNLSVDQQDELVRQVEEHILALQEEFAAIYTIAGTSAGNNQQAEDLIGQIFIEFKDWDQRRPAQEIFADIRQRVAHLAGIIVELREPDQGPSQGKPIVVQIRGQSFDAIHESIEMLRTHFATIEGLVDIEDTRPIPEIEWVVEVDRQQAAKFGLNLQAVGDAVKFITRGVTLESYRPDDSDDEVDIVLRYPEEHRRITNLNDLHIPTPAGNIPVSNFVTIEPRAATGTLNRVDGVRYMEVMADVEPGVIPIEIVNDLRLWIDQTNFPDGVEVLLRGEDEDQREAQAFLQNAFSLALFLMAIILVTQFNSFYSAFLILTAVILSIGGVLMGLMITGQPFIIIMTGVGIISLAGIVVNNNIVLIDTFDYLKKKSTNHREAILRTGAQRLRPVLLTTVTTVLGLIPMVLSMNIDFFRREVSFGAPSTQWWVSLATAIVFGLMFATVLTLVITPCLLKLRIDMRERHRPRIKNFLKKRALPIKDFLQHKFFKKTPG